MDLQSEPTILCFKDGKFLEDEIGASRARRIPSTSASTLSPADITFLETVKSSKGDTKTAVEPHLPFEEEPSQNNRDPEIANLLQTNS